MRLTINRYKRLCLVAPIVLVMLSLALILTGCDGWLGISGTVYEWVDAPPNARSMVYIDKPIPDAVQLVPIKSANITIYFKASYDKGNRSYVLMHTTTDDAGNFEQGRVSDPARNTYVVTVGKEGYPEVSAEFVSPSNEKYQGKRDSPNTNHIIKVLIVKN